MRKFISGKNKFRFIKLILVLITVFTVIHILNKVLSFHLVVNSVIYFTNESSDGHRPLHPDGHNDHYRHGDVHHPDNVQAESKSGSKEDEDGLNSVNKDDGGRLDTNTVNSDVNDDVYNSLPPTCKSKHKHVMFLKTHKCGSTTIQNVFLRFGDTNNLFFVLPSRHNYLGHPTRFNRRLILDPLILKRRFNLSYDVLAHHTRFNYKELMAVMPSDSAFVTVLRNPVSHFESLFEYLDLGNYWPGIPNNTSFDTFLDLINEQTNYTLDIQANNGNNSRNASDINSIKDNQWSISNMLNNIVSNTQDKNQRKNLKSIDNIRRLIIDLNYRFRGKFGRNQMSFDLGFNERYFESRNIISNFVDAIDSIFSIVLISERMDESLILLRHLLCWSYHDMVTFKHNSRIRNVPKYSVKVRNDSRYNQIIRKFNLADDMLYQHFAAKFDVMVNKFGKEKMAKEVQLLRNLTNQYYKKCVDSLKPMKEIVPANYWSSNKVLGIKMKSAKDVNNSDIKSLLDIKNVSDGDIGICTKLTMSEMIYTDKLRKKQQLILRNKKLGFNTDFAAFNNAFDNDHDAE